MEGQKRVWRGARLFRMGAGAACGSARKRATRPMASLQVVLRGAGKPGGSGPDGGQLKPEPGPAEPFSSRSSSAMNLVVLDRINLNRGGEHVQGGLGLDAGDAGMALSSLVRPRRALALHAPARPPGRRCSGSRPGPSGCRAGPAHWRTTAWKPACRGPRCNPWRCRLSPKPPASRRDSRRNGSSWTGR